jgi:tetratricopeptide (TPR) repeat protein
VGAFALALLSKTAVAPLPLALLGLAWWRRGRVERGDVWRSIPFFAVAATMGLITVWFQYYRAIGPEIVRQEGFWSRLAGAGWAVWFYLYKAALPLNLIFVYPRWRIDAANALSYVPGLLVVAGLLVCWRYRRQWGRVWFFSLGYFVVMLLPVLGFLNIYFMRYSLVADHWQYFSIIGPIALAAAGMTTALGLLGGRTPYLEPALGGTLLLALGVLTWRQCGIYADIETLWRDTLKKNPASWLAHNDLGAELEHDGEIDGAIAQYQMALEIEPANAETHNNLGYALLQKGRTDEAILQLQKALELRPGYAHACSNLGLAFRQKGRLDEAAAMFQKALELEPGIAGVHNNLGIVLRQKGRVDEAIAQFQQALAIQPDFAEAYHNLGNALLQKGQVDEAIACFQKALQIQPDYVEAYNHLGTALRRKGRVDEAIAQFQKALKIRPDNASSHNNLANAFLQKGQMDEAIAQYRIALELQPNDAFAHHNLGAVLLHKGQVNEAVSHFEKALEIQPDATTHSDLAAALLQSGRTPEAIAHYQRSLKMQPDNARTLYNLAWVLATCPDASLRNGTNAVELAQRANRLCGGKDPQIIGAVAAAYAETGQFPEAIAAARQALPLAAAQNNTALADALQEQIKLYQAERPFRDTAQTPAAPRP